MIELVWNALDADASDVRVSLGENELGGIDEVRVTDDGTGMTPESPSKSSNFSEALGRRARFALQASDHCTVGRGKGGGRRSASAHGSVGRRSPKSGTRGC